MKSMNLKRFGAAVMGGVMALSLAVPAFAEANVEITGTYTEPEIAVVVTDSGEAQINPYGLPVKLTKSNKATVEITGQQITSSVLSIRNQGTTGLNVNVASFTVKPTGELSIAAAATADKAAKIELEVAALDDSNLAVLTTDKTIEDKLIDKFASDDTWGSLTAANKVEAPAATAASTSITAAKKNNVAVVRAAETDQDGKLKYGAKSIALFRLKGTLAEDPVTGSGDTAVDNPWDAQDGFTANIAFTFKPATANGTTLAVAESSGTVTATFTANTSGLTVEKYEWTSSDTSVATVSADTGTTNTNTVTAAAGATTGATATITVVATLSNGSKLTATTTYTKT